MVLDTPRAVVARAFGGSDSFTLEPFDPEPPGPHEVRIAVAVAGISFVDVPIASGGYQIKPQLPMIPGSEFAGVVEAVGAGVDQLSQGDRVAGMQMTGALAEVITLPADDVYPIPPGVPFDQVAVVRASLATAYHGCRSARRGVGHRVHASEQLTIGAGGATEHEPRLHLRERLAPYKLPKSYKVLSEALRDGAAKARRLAFAEAILSRPSASLAPAESDKEE